MIEVACYSCGSESRTLYATENGCNLVKCGGCGLLYVNPRPSDEEIEEGVKIGLHRGENTLTSTGRYMPLKVAIYTKVLADIYGMELRTQARTWLDVGCGHGELLVALNKLSENKVIAKGIEPNKFKIEAARKKGLEVSYFDLASHGENYDTISLLNVYSHLTSPPDFFQLVRKRLSSKGELLIQTGNTADLPPEQHPRPFLLPDHLSFGSQKVISELLKGAGFQVLSVNRYPAFKLQFMKANLFKDLINSCIPGKSARFSQIYSVLRSTRHRTDMWIRARVAGA